MLDAIPSLDHSVPRLGFEPFGIAQNSESPPKTCRSRGSKTCFLQLWGDFFCKSAGEPWAQNKVCRRITWHRSAQKYESKETSDIIGHLYFLYGMQLCPRQMSVFSPLATSKVSGSALCRLHRAEMAPDPPTAEPREAKKSRFGHTT